jgi:hypothetical protein
MGVLQPPKRPPGPAEGVPPGLRLGYLSRRWVDLRESFEGGGGGGDEDGGLQRVTALLVEYVSWNGS